MSRLWARHGQDQPDPYYSADDAALCHHPVAPVIIQYNMPGLATNTNHRSAQQLQTQADDTRRVIVRDALPGIGDRMPVRGRSASPPLGGQSMVAVYRAQSGSGGGDRGLGRSPQSVAAGFRVRIDKRNRSPPASFRGIRWGFSLASLRPSLRTAWPVGRRSTGHTWRLLKRPLPSLSLREHYR
ncbi:MAG: hypothetical protein M0Z53_01090 [Thermaerobacter sp.]|nr:hypothetical protein [Thermaerobacter sp.]